MVAQAVLIGTFYDSILVIWYKFPTQLDAGWDVLIVLDRSPHCDDIQTLHGIQSRVVQQLYRSVKHFGGVPLQITSNSSVGPIVRIVFLKTTVLAATIQN